MVLQDVFGVRNMMHLIVRLPGADQAAVRKSDTNVCGGHTDDPAMRPHPGCQASLHRKVATVGIRFSVGCGTGFASRILWLSPVANLQTHPINMFLAHFSSTLRRLACFIAAVFCVTHSSIAATTFSIAGGDAGGLQQAINNSQNGDVIELGAGTFAAPKDAFTIYPVTPNIRSITIRAAAGANVTLDGGGNNTDIVRFTDPNCTVQFERITFARGLSTSNALGGAFTLVGVKAVFMQCVFDSNAANGPTGGGAQWIDANAVISFNSCTWTNNTSQKFGGAASIGRDSRVFLRDCRFAGNRSDVGGGSHIPNSDGGALHISNSIVRVDNCSFDNNVAGYTGGAVSVIGDWDHATTEVTINNSSFTSNSASQPRTNAFNTPTFAGAIHAEAMTTLRLSNCRFTGNSAQQGGAIGLYLSAAEIASCVFKDNQTSGAGADESQGGTIAALSAENGGPNYRPVQLTVRDSLFQSTSNAAVGRQGGFIFIAGDLGSAYGIFGRSQNGSPESNRSPLSITRCAFVGGSVQGAAGVGGDGGAIEAIFVNTTIQDSIFTNCSASGGGGALNLINSSVVNIAGSTFTHCSADFTGAALTMFGGTLNVTNSDFARNTGSNGSSAGSTFTTGYANADIGLPAFEINGSISNSTFSDNAGKYVLYDSDRADSLANRFQYSANKFFPDRADLFRSDVAGSLNVAGVNALQVAHSDNTTVVKAPQPNTPLRSAPEIGAVLLLPPANATSGAPGENPPIPSYIVFATDGGNVTLDGGSQTGDNGVVYTLVDARHTLTVGGLSLTTIPVAGAAANIATRLPVGRDDNALIGGFIVAGQTSKRVMIRGIGPSLTAFGVPNALQDPQIELHDGSGATIATNDNWRTTQFGPVITTDQSIDIVASTIAPTADAEAAIIAKLSPGRYTVVVRGTNNTTGIGLVEVYDLDPSDPSKLGNISTRGLVQTGADVMIGGFIYGGGPGATNVIIRGIGPSLTKFGIQNALPNPLLELHDANGATVNSNDDWQTAPNAAAIQSLGFAPSDSSEAVILRTDLARGAYTAVLRDQAGRAGVGLLEAYVFQ